MIIELLYLYATISHGTLATGYISKIADKYREKLIYLAAHVFITFAMLLRIDNKFRGTLIPSLAGTIGHSSLLLFFLLSTFIMHNKYRVVFSGKLYYMNILCILGQIGMIITYWMEFLEGNDKDSAGDSADGADARYNKGIVKYIQAAVFAILAVFYFAVAFKSGNKFSLIFYGLFMIGILYVFFFIKLVAPEYLHLAD
tara:strand:+ start:30 stop:626 length:597 start_codon:yes stop_codon:yes gene_type:complete